VGAHAVRERDIERDRKREGGEREREREGGEREEREGAIPVKKMSSNF